MTAARQAMEEAYAEWETRLTAAPTLRYLYALLKDSKQDGRLSLAQKSLLYEVYRDKMKQEGWSWPT